MAGSTLTVSTQAQLNAAIQQIDAETAPGNTVIELSATITEGASGQPAGLYAIDVPAGVTVTIEGNGYALNGKGADGGLAVLGGKVSIADLTIEDTVAQGGKGEGSGGGGAGLGGGLFVGPNADVSITHVSFKTDAAKGGAGGSGGGGGAGGASSLLIPPLGNSGADGSAGDPGSSTSPGGPGGAGGAGGFGGAGGAGGGGGDGWAPGTAGVAAPQANGLDGMPGGDAGTGGRGGVGGVGGKGGDGGDGGSGGAGADGGAAGAGVSSTSVFYGPTNPGFPGPGYAITTSRNTGGGAVGGMGGDGGNGGTGNAGAAGGYGAGGGAGGAGGDGGKGGDGGAAGSASVTTTIRTGDGSALSSTGGPGHDGGSGGMGGVAGDGADGANGGFGGGGGGGGKGGDGGDGGDGAAGGAGINGFAATSTSPTYVPPELLPRGGAGAGGDGGDGGDGAQGGNGGTGGAGGFGAGGGGGGPGGDGGAAGHGGATGTGGKTYVPSTSGAKTIGTQPNGTAGQDGSSGAAGQAGHGQFGGFGGGGGAGGSIGGAGGGGLGAGGDIFIAQGGVLTVDGGLLAPGSVQGGGGAQKGGALGNGIFLQGNETITLAAPAGQTLTVGGEIIDQTGAGGTGVNSGTGSVSITGDGTVALDAANRFHGGITIDSGELKLGAAGAAGSGTIRFAANGADPTLAFDAATVPTNPISGLGAGDFIQVSDKTVSGVAYSPGSDGGTLQIDFQGGGDVDLKILGEYSQGDFSFAGDEVAVDATPCYRRGTRILTDRGEVAVEHLEVGDLVLVASGARRPVRWLGSRRVDCSRHPDPTAVWPIRIQAGAFAQGLPARHLWVSPGHSIFVDGVLIPAEKLVNDASIRQEPVATVEYWHVELDGHDCIMAEGLAAESYLDTGNRAAFLNGGAYLEAHPDFKPKHWAETCVPLVFDGAILQGVKSRLLARAQALGYSLTADSDLHVMAAGERIEPVFCNEQRVAFVIPPGRTGIELRCRGFVPAHVDAASVDHRRLGVCVARLQIDGIDLPVDDAAAFERGWHDVEVHSPRYRQRWSKESAPLPDGAQLVVIHRAGRSYCWTQQSRAERAVMRRG